MGPRSVLAPVIAAAVLAGALGCGGSSDRGAPSASGPSPTARPGSTPTVSLDELNTNLRSATRQMSGMVAELPGGQVMSSAQGEMTSRARMAAMTASMNDLANTLTQVVRQMQAVLADEHLMQEPGMDRAMSRMEQNLATVLAGFSSMVDDLEQIQGQSPPPQ